MAGFPHCDGNVLHAPGECEYCDHYPFQQQQRVDAGINFTGEHDPDKETCPSERVRNLDVIERWHGNVKAVPEAKVKEVKKRLKELDL
ncbi:MAG: hypothetical protein NVS9B9_24960 [Ktedonobacteraceae bacterium]